jgi:hypothetical protein
LEGRNWRGRHFLRGIVRRKMGEEGEEWERMELMVIIK